MKFIDFLKESEVALSSSIDTIGKYRIEAAVKKSVTDNGFKYVESFVTQINQNEVIGYAAYNLLSYTEKYKENNGDKSEMRYIYLGEYKYNISTNKVTEFKESTQRYSSISEINTQMNNSEAVKL